MHKLVSQCYLLNVNSFQKAAGAMHHECSIQFYTRALRAPLQSRHYATKSSLCDEVLLRLRLIMLLFSDTITVMLLISDIITNAHSRHYTTKSYSGSGSSSSKSATTYDRQALDHLVVPENTMESCAPLLAEPPPPMHPETTNHRNGSSLAAAGDSCTATNSWPG